MSLRIGSLCSGYEGLGIAVQHLLGGELAWVADNDPGASKVLAHRFPGVKNLGDITVVDWSQVEPVDVLCAGFPCQDISYAGQGQGIQEGNRSGLWYVIADAIGVLRPGLVVLENVAALVARRPGLDVVLGSLAGLGFDAEWCCIRASDVGAPHGRHRWFAIAYAPPADSRRGRGSGPAGTRQEPGESGRSQPEPDDGRLGAIADSGRDARPGDDAHLAALAWRGDATAQDAYGPASSERRLAAPGQAESGRARADAGGPGGAPAADAERDGLRRGAGCPGEADEQGAGSRAAAEGRGTDAPADPDGGRWRPGEPDHAEGEPDASRGAAADADRGGRDGLHERQQPGHMAADTGQRSAGIRAGTAPGETDWGIYEPAISRWERILGRPAPSPTVPGRGGKPRLNPALPEWMMGLPEGWVTDVPGLSRNDMLRACGNGVVIHQAVAAYSMLLPAWLEAVRAGEAA